MTNIFDKLNFFEISNTVQRNSKNNRKSSNLCNSLALNLNNNNTQNDISIEKNRIISARENFVEETKKKRRPTNIQTDDVLKKANCDFNLEDLKSNNSENKKDKKLNLNDYLSRDYYDVIKTIRETKKKFMSKNRKTNKAKKYFFNNTNKNIYNNINNLNKNKKQSTFKDNVSTHNTSPFAQNNNNSNNINNNNNINIENYNNNNNNNKHNNVKFKVNTAILKKKESKNLLEINKRTTQSILFQRHSNSGKTVTGNSTFTKRKHIRIKPRMKNLMATLKHIGLADIYFAEKMKMRQKEGKFKEERIKMRLIIEKLKECQVVRPLLDKQKKAMVLKDNSNHINYDNKKVIQNLKTINFEEKLKKNKIEKIRQENAKLIKIKNKIIKDGLKIEEINKYISMISITDQEINSNILNSEENKKDPNLIAENNSNFDNENIVNNNQNLNNINSNNQIKNNTKYFKNSLNNKHKIFSLNNEQSFLSRKELNNKIINRNKANENKMEKLSDQIKEDLNDHEIIKKSMTQIKNNYCDKKFNQKRRSFYIMNSNISNLKNKNEE